MGMSLKIICIGNDTFSALVKEQVFDGAEVLVFGNHRDRSLIDALVIGDTVQYFIAEQTLDKGGSGIYESQGFMIVYPFLKYLSRIRDIKAKFNLYGTQKDGLPGGLWEVNNGDNYFSLQRTGLLVRGTPICYVDTELTEQQLINLYNHEINYIKVERAVPPKIIISSENQKAMKTRYKILIPVVDDEVDQRVEIEKGLKLAAEGDQMFCVDFPQFATGVDLLKFIRGENMGDYGDVQAILLDWFLYNDSGNDEKVLSLIKDIRKIRPNIYIYILTKSTDYGQIVGKLNDLERISYQVKGEEYSLLWQQVKRDLLKRMTAPFWRAYKEYASSGIYSWHTPGHSGGNSISRSQYIKELYDFFGPNIFRADLSVSVDELGSLFGGSGKVKDAQDYVAKVFGSKMTYFVTNGSSTSNKILLQYLLKKGETVIVDRNCHKSVHYGLIQGDFNAVYLNSQFSAETGFFAPPSKAEISDAISKNVDAKLVILTGCTYDGIMMDLADIIQFVKSSNPKLKVMIDEAWFCYSSFHPAYEEFSALKSGADYVTHSAHKVLSAFSQASYIHINDDDFDESFFMEAFCMNTSTSPQYNLMASLELSAVQMEMEGFKIIDTIRREAIELAKEFNSTSKRVKILTGKDLVNKFDSICNDGCNTDPLKIVIDFSNSGLDMKYVLEAFKEKGIQVEKITRQGYILLLYTIGSSKSKTGNLYHLLLNLEKKASIINSQTQNVNSSNSTNKKGATLNVNLLNIEKPSNGFHYYFYHKDKTYLTLTEIQSIISSGIKVYNCHLIVPYPPGIPLLIPGTEITEEKCNYLTGIVQTGGEIHGLRENKMAVILND